MINVKIILVFFQDYSSKWNSHVCIQKQHSIQRERSCLWAVELEQKSLKHWELFGTITGGLLTKRFVGGLTLPPSPRPLSISFNWQEGIRKEESTTGNLDDKRCLIYCIPLLSALSCFQMWLHTNLIRIKELLLAIFNSITVYLFSINIKLNINVTGPGSPR